MIPTRIETSYKKPDNKRQQEMNDIESAKNCDRNEALYNFREKIKRDKKRRLQKELREIDLL